MIPNRADYKCVAGDLFAQNAQGDYTVRIDGSSMFNAQTGSFRRVVPHGEDICWLTEALCVRSAFTGVRAPVTFTDRSGNLVPYPFYRGPHSYASVLTNQVAADIELPAQIVKSYNNCFNGRTFLYPTNDSGPGILGGYVARGVSGASAYAGISEFFWGDGGWHPGYKIAELDQVHGETPRSVGDKISYMEFIIRALRWGFTPYPEYDLVTDLGFTGSVSDYRESGYGPDPLPTVNDYKNKKYLIFYDCEGVYGNGHRSYWVVKGHAENPLVVSLGTTCAALHNHITRVWPVYRYTCRYIHWEGSGSTEAHSGTTVFVSSHAYSLASDGTVSLNPYSDIDDYYMYGGNLNESTPPRASSVPELRSFTHNWWATLENVSLIVEFDQAVSSPYPST